MSKYAVKKQEEKLPMRSRVTIIGSGDNVKVRMPFCDQKMRPRLITAGPECRVSLLE